MGKGNNAYIMGFVDSTPFNIESGISIQVDDDSVEKTNEASVTGASEVEFCSCGIVMKKTESTWECPSCGKTKPEAESKEEKQNPNTDENGGETQSKGSPRSSQNSLADLRSEAVESAVEEVPETNNSTDHSTTQYTRSSEVRDYVKAWADGTCEGCGDPAPFISKTGEPYLHAHHIHELSNGGSDSPDTVVALCPN